MASRHLGGISPIYLFFILHLTGNKNLLFRTAALTAATFADGRTSGEMGGGRGVMGVVRPCGMFLSGSISSG